MPSGAAFPLKSQDSSGVISGLISQFVHQHTNLREIKIQVQIPGTNQLHGSECR